jgi:membrane protein DedA with SNARE-associated domain
MPRAFPGRSKSSRARRHRPLLLGLAALRGLLAIVAIPLAPALYDDHFVLLVLLRPTKDVLLFGGFLLRDGRVGLLPILVAAVPLAILGVWHFYFIGRAYAHELRSKDGLPRWARTVISPKRVKSMEKLIDEHRRTAILVGRLSVFPSTVLGAAAGAADVRPAEFLPLDALGASLSIAEVLLAGYVFGSAYDKGGRLITVVGVVLLVGGLVALGRWLRRHGS